ncbi:hypothetical protein LCGC14_0939180 [marine sediment metagenome]|uniref:Uncharacterized protein n=1 Tax=marine sediment metagenome TaxID=412755 RepID=A0A0F9NQ99_9ZZZZ
MEFDAIMDRQSPDKKLFISAGSDISLTLNQRHVFVAGASGPQTFVRLPNVGEAEGYPPFILSVTTVPATTGAAVKVFYNNGGTSALSTALNTTGVELSFKSAGIVWSFVRSS